MTTTDVPLPRHDFYQTPAHLILSLYVKGYSAPELVDQVKVAFCTSSVEVELPSLEAADGTMQQIVVGPLNESILPDQSSARILATKIELKLAKASPTTWPALLLTSATGPKPTSISQLIAGQSSIPPSAPTGLVGDQSSQPKPKARRNWDKVLDDELDEPETEQKDPNAGGDASLQKFFSQLYSNADEDTRRAMIKSFTESGGTTLSTDWSSIGKEKTPTRPPEGMEAKKY